MLEYDDFNELDNDFITAWSKYFLRGQQAEIIKEIEYLAEMGQVNAVQCWYLFRRKGQSQNIDKVADYLCKGANFNFLYLRANQEGVQETINKVKKIYSDLDFKYEKDERRGYAHWGDFKTEFLEEIENKTPYYKLALAAIKSANDEYEQTKNLFVGERVLEMLSGFRGMWPFDKDKVKFKNEAMLNAKKLRKYMMIEYEKLKKQNPNITVDDCPQLAYALGKNCFSLSNPIFGKSTKKLGKQLLTDLSNRPYSTMLEVYKNKREKEKERQQFQKDKLQRERNRKFLNDFLEQGGGLENMMSKAGREMDGIVDEDFDIKDLKLSNSNFVDMLK